MAHHYNKPKRFEISNQFINSASCDKCTIVLTTSIYKDQLVAYSTKANIRHGWLCVRCMIKLGKATCDDLDKFLIANYENLDRYLVKELNKCVKPFKNSQTTHKK